MSEPIRVISSMATRQVLADLVAQFEGEHLAHRVSVESVGGVDAARRVRAGEAFDAVVLAASAIDELIDAGRIVAGSRVDLVRSGVAIAVRRGAEAPDVGSEDAVKRAVLAARSIGYSTGPSGTHLTRLFERWGIAELIKSRIVQAPPGVSVGSLIASGEAALGFQQRSELMHLDGVHVLGALPPEIQIITVFSAGLAVASARPGTVRELFEFMQSPGAAASKRRHGMEPG